MPQFIGHNKIFLGSVIFELGQQRDWVGGVRTSAIFQTFSAMYIYADVGWVNESEKVQKFADVILQIRREMCLGTYVFII